MATQPYSDPYAELGLTRDASAAEIKTAYFALVRAHPPERDAHTFKRIRAAYERLRDDKSREETDMLLLESWRTTGRRRALEMDLALHREDIIDSVRALSDLARTDWREHYRKVEL